MPVLGGQASGRTFDGSAALFRDELVLEEGAVGLVFEGVPMAPCVSQGAAPLGPELTITRAEGRVIHELAGRPALAKLREVFDELDERDQRRIRSGLLLGIVIDAGKPEYEQGDFLVRGVVGADSESGSIALGEEVHAGQVVRLHARDARSADRDLEEGLQARRAALGGAAPAGALCFTCTGRGRRDVRRRRSRRGAARARARGRPDRRLLRRGRDRPGPRRSASSTPSRQASPLFAA